MKRLTVLFLTCCLLLSFTALAIAESSDAIHLFEDIPFGLTLDEAKETAEQALEVSFIISEQKEDETQHATATTDDYSFLGKTVDNISLYFAKEGDTLSLNRIPVSFLVEDEQSNEYYAEYFADIYNQLFKLYGEPIDSGLNCIFDFFNTDTQYYDCPANDGVFDVDTLAKATDNNIYTSCYASFDNLQLMYFAFGQPKILINYYEELLSPEDYVKIGYYGSKESISAITDFTYRAGVTFGMSMAEVASLEASEPSESDDMLMYFAEQAAGKSAILMYYFDDSDSLYRIGLLFTETHSSNNKYITDFESVDEALESKYGKATVDQKYTWHDSLFKDSKEDYGLAVAAEQLSIVSSWENNGYLITHGLQGDNYDIVHLLAYTLNTYTSTPNTSGI